MGNRKTFRSLGLVVLLIVGFSSDAQVSQLSNTVTLPTEYIGCNSSSTQPLRFTTELNFPHQ